MALAIAASLQVVPAASAEAAVSDASASQKLSFRGMTLTIPAAWKVTYERGYHRQWVSVDTAACHRRQITCPGFDLVGPKIIKGGDDIHIESYRRDRAWEPGTSVSSCRFGRDMNTGERFLRAKPVTQGLRKVGRGHRAEYREWAGECYSMATGKRTRRFTQRLWYLPKTQILIADGWNNPSLARILERATWR
ncbi:hypothetical protein [Nonomuraea sp. NPDC050783]|uniref:hypothetical protein n=1 Tax=Nonomuraea sp. NPDC050783 TaxID=3154634 RepID=UPI00346742C1